MKNKEFSLYSLQKRISAIIIAISFLFFSLVLRLFCVQIFNSAILQNKAESQWTRDLKITAPRGKIYDKNGATLAVSFSSYDVYVRKRQVKDINKLCNVLSKKLNLSYNYVYQKATKPNVSEVLIKMQVDSNTVKQIMLENVSGIYFSESVKRFYPYGNTLTQLLGYTSIDNKGQSGIEAYFDKTLKGKDGSYIVQSDLQGKEIKNSLQTYINSISGNNLYLTINVNVQNIVEDVLEKVMLEQKCKSASCVIMEANSGNIVACSTKPSFDLNNIPRNNVNTLMDMSKNKIALDVYEPGSTFKILTMASALESNKANLNDHFYCPGYSIVDGQRIKCWRSIGHGSQNLTEGLVNSCNCVFMALAQRMGVERFYSYLTKLGLGKKTGIEIASESSGILMDKSIVKNVDLARIGFGHAVAVTPLQLITAICCVVNGGTLYKPNIVQKETNFNGKIETENFAQKKDKVISINTSKTVNEMLKKVVNKKQEYSFVEGYDVGGKTGTAQKYQNGTIARGKYVSSFVGTFPASNPKYVMLILVDEPGAGAYYGSVVAMPYGREIFSKLFTFFNEPKIKDVKVEECLMPNITGLSLNDAIKILNNLNLSYEIDGSGGIVTKQLPPVGTKILPYQTVIIEVK